MTRHPMLCTSRTSLALFCKALFLFSLLSAVEVAPTKPIKEGKSQPPGKAKKEARSLITETPESYESKSVKHVTGWFRIHVIGTGKRCLVKEKEKGKSMAEQFGDTTETSAFMSFYGTPECEEGDKGNAKGKMRAWVVAEAYKKGDDCLAKVLSSVVADSTVHKIHKDVTVTVGGDADGDALAICDEDNARQVYGQI